MLSKTNEEYKKIFSRSDWDIDTLKAADEVIQYINEKYLQLSFYPNQFEIVGSEQLLDVYSLTGLPISYHHWKFGKDFVIQQNQYKRGQMGLSYELVINSNPCISYNLEENTTCLMTLVMAHAAIGHNSFFKNNYLFKQWTEADAIIDYMVFAKNYILGCEEKYGYDAVEETLDAAHALMNYGVSKFKSPYKMSAVEEEKRQDEIRKDLRLAESDLWRTLPKKDKEKAKKINRFPDSPEENILYFLEKNSPIMEPWQKEIIRIVRKTAQYFYPQGQTKVLNEGVATMTHYSIINHMFDEDLLPNKFMQEFIQHHSGVINQLGYDHPYYSGFNPYKLGFEILADVKRICDGDWDEEDKEWFPKLIGADWVETFHHIIENYKDDSFIAQFLGPKVIKKLKMFSFLDYEDESFFTIDAIHNKIGYKKIVESLSNYYNRSRYTPEIEVYDVDIYGNRCLTLKYTSYDKRELNMEQAIDTLDQVRHLWGFPVRLISIDENGEETVIDELD